MKTNPVHLPATAARRASERGGAGLKLVIVIAIIALAAFVAARVGPVLYDASLFKVHMQDTVDKAVALGQASSWVEAQLRASAADYDVPKDAVYKVEQKQNSIDASVTFKRTVEFPGYVYTYDFSHAVKSRNFITPQ